VVHQPIDAMSLNYKNPKNSRKDNEELIKAVV
jgi:hypothetical protein